MPDSVLKNYQETGRDFLTDDFAKILGDEPGLGKTAQAITAAAKAGAKRILVICPSILLVNWEREFQTWWKTETDAPLPKIVRADVAFKNTVPRTGPLICIINIDKFSQRDNIRRVATNVWARFAIDTKWDVVIIDEAHSLKSMGSNRTKSIYGELRKNNPVSAKVHWWPVSGTLLVNHAGDLYPHLRALLPHLITKSDGKVKTQREFEDEYCEVEERKFGARRMRVIVGSKNLPQLRKLIGPYFLARRSQDVLKELPPLRFVEHPIDLKPKSEQAKRLLAETNKKISELVKDCETEDEILEALSSDLVALSTQRRLIGTLKAESIAELVDNELMDNPVDKRIIFLHHTDAIDKIAEHLKNYRKVILHGKTPLHIRAGLADQFQNDPDTRIFIGQTTVCREGLTLTASNQVILGEPSWVPKDNFQAAKRASRIGQTKPVLARLISATNTADDLVMRVIARKTQELAEFFG